MDNSVDNVENFLTVEKLSTLKMRFSGGARVSDAFFVDNSVDNGDKPPWEAFFAPALLYAAYAGENLGKAGICRE